MKKRCLSTVLFALLWGCMAYAQGFDTQRLDTLLKRIEQAGRGMGSLSICKEGREVYQKSYGYADVGSGIKNSATTKFRIGSITKSFTATLIMKLVEDNRLTLNTPLSDYYPQITHADQITISQLLQHRSGIANFTNVADYLSWNGMAHTKEQLLERIVAGGATFAPNARFEYSNANYVLLTYIIEDVTKTSYAEWLQEVILKPCKLTHTAVGGPIRSAKNEARSYRKLTDWRLEKETDMSIPLGAGFITSTPTDLNLFFEALFAEKIVTAASLKQMTTIMDGFGLGLIRVPFYEKVGYGHTGGIDGFQANAFYFPQEKVSISLTANGVVYPLNDIIVGALSIYFGKEFQLPQFTAFVAPTEELTHYLGIYSCPTFPLKITITREGTTLVCQATGQPSFPLEYVGNHQFKFDQAKLALEFIPTEGRMILKQNGMVFDMKRE